MILGSQGTLRTAVLFDSCLSRIPRTVECELTGDIVDLCLPGDVATVTGEVKVVASDQGKTFGKKDQAMFLLYLSVNSITR